MTVDDIFSPKGFGCRRSLRQKQASISHAGSFNNLRSLIIGTVDFFGTCTHAMSPVTLFSGWPINNWRASLLHGTRQFITITAHFCIKKYPETAKLNSKMLTLITVATSRYYNQNFVFHSLFSSHVIRPQITASVSLNIKYRQVLRHPPDRSVRLGDIRLEFRTETGFMDISWF
jgi:hypothetical protein